MSKEITPIPANIFDEFETKNPQYVVFGIAQQQTMPGQPPKFQNVRYAPASDEELMQAIRQCNKRFKVFSVSGAQVKSEAEWKKESDEFFKQKEYESEIAQMTELMKKHPSEANMVQLAKMEVVHD